MNSQVGESLGEQQLRAAYDITEAGEYESALANLERARSSCPANIYIIALERQLKTLMEFLDAQELGEARRVELIGPMPGLIECALRELKKPERHGGPELTQSRLAQGGSEPAIVPEGLPLPEQHETARNESAQMVVITIIMGAIVLAGAAYAAFLLNRNSSAGIKSRVIKIAQLEDAAISTTPAVTAPVEPSQISNQNVSKRTPAESSPSPGKPGPVATGASVPLPGAQHVKSGSAIPDPGKLEPVQSQIQKPIHKAETKEKPGSAPVAPSPPGISAPHVLAASMPENKPVGSGISGAEAAPASSPAFVPTQKEPQVVKLERPEIPDYIWMSGVVERVVIKVLIDVDGKPIDTQVLMSSKSTLEKPVIKAVMNSKFLPGQSAIGPVKTWLTIPFKIATSK